MDVYNILYPHLKMFTDMVQFFLSLHESIKMPFGLKGTIHIWLVKEGPVSIYKTVNQTP